MPNNTDPGMIEDFYLRAIPDEDLELELAHTFVSSIPNPKFRLKISKSKYRVWLAIQKVPFGPAGALSVGQVSLHPMAVQTPQASRVAVTRPMCRRDPVFKLS